MKRPQNEKLISSLLETINPKLIADDTVRQMVELGKILFAFREQNLQAPNCQPVTKENSDQD